METSHPLTEAAPLVKRPPSAVPIGLLRWRWLNLLLFALLSACNALLWIAFSPIAKLVGSYFGVSDLQVNLLSITYMALAIPGTPLATWVLDHVSLGIAIYLSAFLNGAGAALRYYGARESSGYWFVLGGQSLCAVAQPFILSAPAKLAGTWFSDKERVLATTVGSISNVLGIAAGFVMSPAMVNSPSDVTMLMMVQLAIAGGIMLLILMLFRSRPSIAPSYSALQASDSLAAVGAAGAVHMTFKEAIKSVMRNRAFLIIFFAFGVSLGVFNALVSLLNQWVDPYGYSDDDTGILGGVLIMSGVVGSGIVSVIVDRYKNYGAVMRICFFMCLVATILLSILLKSDAMLLLCILFGATGFFGMPLLPVCLEASAELVYPVGEALPSGLLMLSGQIWGILLILAGNGLQSWQGRPQPAIYTMAGLLAIATLTIMFFRGKYKRYELEQQRHRALEEANRVDAVLS